MRGIILSFGIASLVMTANVSAQSHNWLLGGGVTGGSALTDGMNIYGGWDAYVERVGPRWGQRFVYERIWFVRQCETSDPPFCSIDVADGRLMLIGVSRQLTPARRIQVLLRPEMGVAVWTNNSEDGTFGQLLGGAAAEIRGPAGTGALLVGASLRGSRAATTAGLSVALAIRL